MSKGAYGNVRQHAGFHILGDHVSDVLAGSDLLGPLQVLFSGIFAAHTLAPLTERGHESVDEPEE